MLPTCLQAKLRSSVQVFQIMLAVILMLGAFSAFAVAPNAADTPADKQQGILDNRAQITLDKATQAADQPTTTKVLTVNDSPDAAQILENISAQVPYLMRFVTALAYVMGMYLIFMGILKLKQYGEARTQMSSQHHLKEPMIFIVVGVLLLYLPTTVQIGLSTFWKNPYPYSYVPDNPELAPMFNSVFLVIQLFGTIALVRGLLMLSHLGGGGGGQNSLAKGMTHIIGGLLCINLYGLVEVILITFGFLK